MGIIKKIRSKVKDFLYDEYKLNTKEDREKTILHDWNEAKIAKEPIKILLQELDDYYKNNHYSKDQILALASKNGWDFIPPVITDCFKVVEQSIDNEIPDFIFKGRDDDLDSQIAKEREEIVKYVLYNNKIDELMPENERNLGKSKNAFWKVSWDNDLQFSNKKGDIKISNPNPSNIFPDPSAVTIDDCEYLFYVYRIHKKKAIRMFGELVKDISTDNKHYETEIYSENNKYISDGRLYDETSKYNDNTMQVQEYWFRQPYSGNETIDGVKYNWESGDIGVSILIDNTEVKYIPNYWQNTSKSGNKSYPFIKYARVEVSQSFWDRSDIENIKELVEFADRELMSAMLNDMYNGQDITVLEEDCLMDGEELSNEPGAIVKVKNGRLNSIRRLGNISNNTNSINTINWIQQQIEETNGNNGINAGEKPPSNVNTFSGMALLAEQGKDRQNKKKTSRNLAFRKLFELIDWSVLEFYNTDRLITIRGSDGVNKMFKFNSSKFKQIDKEELQRIEDTTTDEEYFNLREQLTYYPRIDTEIILSNPIAQSRAMTIQATSEIMKSLDNINKVKAELLKSQIEIMGLINKTDLIKAIDDTLEEQETIKQQQQLLLQQSIEQNQQIPQGGVNYEI